MSDSNSKLYVGNLPYSVTSNDLQDIFSKYGEVRSAEIVSYRETNRSKGFGFVKFADDSSANSAIEALDGSELSGRTIKVNIAKPKKPADNNRRYGGGDSYR